MIKRIIKKIQEYGTPEVYEVAIGFTVYILTILVGFNIAVNTGNIGTNSNSGFKIIGLGLVSQVVFWVGNVISKKLKQSKEGGV